MTTIAPAVLCESIEDYQATITRLEPFATRVHIDISDGEFAPTFTVGVNQLYWPTNWEVDLHAMVARPSEYLPALLALNPTDAYRLLTLGAGGAGGLTGIDALAGHTALTPPILIAVLLAWTAAPLALAALVFARREL